jgi:hypothetical protein
MENLNCVMVFVFELLNSVLYDTKVEKNRAELNPTL